MRFLRQSLTGLFLLSVTVALLAMAAQLFTGALQERLSKEPRSPQQRERVFTVNVIRAAADTIAPQLAAFGEVQSQRQLDIRASAAGMIVQMDPAFREGGQVTAGQFLLQINPSTAEAALARAENELRAAGAELRDAERSFALAADDLTAAEEQAALRTQAFDRQKDLEERGVGTAAAIEGAELSVAAARQQVLSRRQALGQGEARIDQAKSRLERAEIALSEAQRTLDDLTLRADFDGILSDVTAIRGGLVSTNERLARLIDPDALEVAFRVSTAQYARLLDQDGRLRPKEVAIALDVSGFVLSAEGRISRDSAAVGDGQTGRLIFATLTAARGLKPGDFVSVSVTEDAIQNVVRLPASAVDAQGRVMAVADDNRLEALPVTLLRRQGDDVLVRAPGLDGRDIVTQLTPLLGPGIRVKPVTPGAEAPQPAAPAADLLELSEERRAKLLAFVSANERIPADRKQRMIDQLSQPQVPAQIVSRLESRMGG
ncbi:HlyD family efflux transporter periplasmic adaptor subunit [Cognatishimia sp. SS12]|uniref:efflux RND transporter periplasmic adaptor subunit n=1 Tax=Cognatishimia sp. SS12 TaxID=2979465 RepID=UPI00232BB84B|nr:HlyD family efflux transporter periplasmic adaptor subunit [Cognatishimia sp. SS12]MDC0739097.1 HlyD family efflux transporter periplasmic adaptor subunit [Cognatishimia sp. SS12]